MGCFWNLNSITTVTTIPISGRKHEMHNVESAAYQHTNCIKLAIIVFTLLRDPVLSDQTNKRTNRQNEFNNEHNIHIATNSRTKFH